MMMIIMIVLGMMIMMMIVMCSISDSDTMRLIEDYGSDGDEEADI